MQDLANQLVLSQRTQPRLAESARQCVRIRTSLTGKRQHRFAYVGDDDA
jgi:hypothetical protein